MLKINTFKLLTAATMAGCLFAAAQPALAETKLVTVDGSSTVFPITEAVAEDFQKAKKGAINVTVGTILPCDPDITGDHVVNVNDLLAVISAWGACQ